MKFLAFLIVFLLIGAFFIISNENLNLDNKNNIDIFLSEYGQWIGKLIDNSRIATGYIVKMGWLPE
jgi:hypothetical protein